MILQKNLKRHGPAVFVIDGTDDEGDDVVSICSL
jgi:hypothetical protein